jgi:hypothetical protein
MPAKVTCRCALRCGRKTRPAASQFTLGGWDATPSVVSCAPPAGFPVAGCAATAIENAGLYSSRPGTGSTHGKLEQAQAARTEQATHDALTGLPNRKLLIDRATMDSVTRPTPWIGGRPAKRAKPGRPERDCPRAQAEEGRLATNSIRRSQGCHFVQVSRPGDYRSPAGSSSVGGTGLEPVSSCL